MYAGARRSGLGCAGCQSHGGLGANVVISPNPLATILQSAPAILKAIGGLFQGSSYDETHQAILGWSATIVGDPGLTTAAARDAWLRLRCWAGDQTVITPADTAELFGGGNVSQGCGCETAHGCRADAQAAVATLQANIPSLTTGNLSTSSYTDPVTGLPAAAPPSSSGTGATIQTTLPNGFSVNTPVAASSILNATLFGLPVSLLALGGVVLAFSGGHSAGRRR